MTRSTVSTFVDDKFHSDNKKRQMTTGISLENMNVN